MFKFFVVLAASISLYQKGLGEPLLLVSTKQDIRIVDAEDPDKVPSLALLTKYVEPDEYLYHKYLDYHYAEKLVCWSDVSKQTVQCVGHNQTYWGSKESQPSVLVAGLHVPEGVAVDWVGGILYWADSESACVEAVQLHGQHYRRVLYWANLTNVNAIALAPHEGLLFWSTWGGFPKIEIASMSGSDGPLSPSDPGSPIATPARSLLVSQDIVWPNGLAVDGPGRRVYWVDSNKDTPSVESVAFDGSRRNKILNKELSHPFALSYYKGSLYWSDWNTKSIHMCILNKQDKCGVPHKISCSNSTTFVRVYSSELQPQLPCDASQPSTPCPASPCQQAPCSHMCLLAPSRSSAEALFTSVSLRNSIGSVTPFAPSPATYQCVCPTGITVLPDQHTCRDGPEQFLMLARTGGLFRVSLDLPDHTVLPLDTSGEDNDTRHDASDVDYDPVEDEIYWVDGKLKAVRATREYTLSPPTTRTVLTDLEHNGDLTLDPRARNLYWSDETRHCIWVASMDGESRMVIVWTELGRPRALAVHSRLALLFWTDWGASPKIERATTLGKERRVIINTELQWPNGLVVDEDVGAVCWVDGSLNKLECCGLDGSDRRVVSGQRPQHLSGLTLLHGSAYWLDLSERAVASVRLHDGVRTDILHNVRYIHDIKAVHRTRPLLKDPSDPSSPPATEEGNVAPCARVKAGCSHMCFHTPASARGYECRCPPELEMSGDNHTCLLVPSSGAFLLYSGGGGQAEARAGYVSRLSIVPPHQTQLLPLTPLRRTVGLSYDPVSGMVYVSDSGSRTVRRADLDGGGEQLLLRHGLALPQALAVDAINRNLYWIDMELNRLEVSRLDGLSRRVLVWRDIDRPYSLAVEPVTAALYWFEFGSDAGVLKRSWLDGSHVRPLVTGLGHSVAITAEPPQPGRVSARLYWTDADHGRVESCDDSGLDRRVLVREVEGGAGVGVWAGRVYWAGQQRVAAHSTHYALYRADANTGTGVEVIKSGLVLSDIVFTIAQHNTSLWTNDTSSSALPPSSVCMHNNSGCSHLCLPPPILPPLATASHLSGYEPQQEGVMAGTPSACACPTHYTLDDQHKSCLPPTHFLVFAQKNAISRLLDTTAAPAFAGRRDDGAVDECPSVVLALKGVRNVGAIAYDPNTHTVYWVDKKYKKDKKVWAAQEHAPRKQVMLDNPLSSAHPHSLVLDYVSGLLFMSCAQHNTVNVTRQSVTSDGDVVYTNLGTVVSGPGDSPRALALHAPLRRLFFVNMAAPAPRIEWCRVDGMQRTLLVEGGLTEPTALAVDEAGAGGMGEGRLYWFDVRSARIESVTLDGTRRRVEIFSSSAAPLERVMSLTVLRGYLYWLDAGRGQVGRGSLRSINTTRTVVLDRLSDLVDMVAVDVEQASRSHPCASQHNQCSQLCLTTTNGTADRGGGGVTAIPRPAVATRPYTSAGVPRGLGGRYGGSNYDSSNINNYHDEDNDDVIYHDTYRERSPNVYGFKDVYISSDSVGVYSGGVGTLRDGKVYRSSGDVGNAYPPYTSSHSAISVLAGYSPGPGSYSPPGGGYSGGRGTGGQAMCGCVTGQVLMRDGWRCVSCVEDQHFVCAHDPFVCVHQHHRCDGVPQCPDGSDEVECPPLPCQGVDCTATSKRGEATSVTHPPGSNKAAYVVGVVVCALVLLVLATILVYYRRRPPLEDALVLAAVSAGLKNKQQQQLLPRGCAVPSGGGKPGSSRYLVCGGVEGGSSSSHQRLLGGTDSAKACSVGCLNGSCGGHPHQHLNGGVAAGEMFSLTPTSPPHASSSSSSTTHYPKETVNPPPTPTTCQPTGNHCYSACYPPPPQQTHMYLGGRLVYYPTGGTASTQPASAASGSFLPLAVDHSYRHYKTRNRPPPPTPCSTDICDDSDMNSTALMTPTPSYSSDTNTDPHHHHHYAPHHHHHKPQRPYPCSLRHHPTNSPSTQYCSFSSLPRTDYYGDSDPDPPPPTPQPMMDDGSCHSTHHESGRKDSGRQLRGVLEEERGGVEAEEHLLNASSSRGDRFYCPPPPSPVASD